MTSTIYHSLRNSIGGILLASQSLADDLPEASGDDGILVRAILRSCQSMLQLLDDEFKLNGGNEQTAMSVQDIGARSPVESAHSESHALGGNLLSATTIHVAELAGVTLAGASHQGHLQADNEFGRMPRLTTVRRHSPDVRSQASDTALRARANRRQTKTSER